MRVVVAMSGGVDSSVAAALLREQGHEVIGVHMKLHDRSPTAIPGACCGLDDALDAARVADRLDVPFYVFDLQEAFRAAVMDDFARTWLGGGTPNPCVKCNGVLKFRVLLGRALELGADALATGHYARIVDGAVATAVDLDKDQSYFLFPLGPDALRRTLFPLGGLTKAEVRAHAARLGLATAQKAESQDVCFLPGGDHAAFVKEWTADHGAEDASGDIVTEDGRVVGRHDAWWRFTIGQRRGLHVALGAPAYVLRVVPARREVVVTTDPARLGSLSLQAQGAVWVERPTPDRPVEVRVRHRGARVPARVHAQDDGTFSVAFDEPVRAVARGQAAVVYDGVRVLGGGFVRSAGGAPADSSPARSAD
jgi:tRNA-specific 2-thiouridylase